MTYERDQERSRNRSADDHDEITRPGRVSRSAGLNLSSSPTSSGILMRKGEGEVADGAESAVAAASSSSGHSLPGELKSRFESSLGTDLSSVRLHTGGESAQAAGSVSARAYAIGNDVHFGAGQYNPGSSSGQTLIAHEVAHTVQQRGGSSGPQFKLAMSSPGDHFEREADRAADAMVAGTPTTVGSASGLSRQIFRETNAQRVNIDGEDAAQNKAAELDDTRKHGYGTGDTTTYMGGSSNVGDRSQAIQMLNLIASQSSAIAGSTNADRLAQNNAAEEALRSYVTASSDQNFAQSLFEPEFDKVKVSFARLEAMFQTHFAKASAKAGGGTGVDLANQAATAGTATKADDASDLKRRLQQQGSSSDIVTNNEMQSVKADIQALQRQLGGYGPALSGTSAAVINAHKELRGATRASEIPPALAEDDAEKSAKTAVEGVKSDLESAVATVNEIGSLAKKAIGAVPGGTEALEVVTTAKESFETGCKLGNAAARKPGDPVPKVDTTEDVVKYFTNFDAKLASAEGKLANVKDGKHRAWARNALDQVKTKGDSLKAAFSAHQRAQAAFDSLQVSLRMQTEKLIRLMPKAAPGQPDLGVALSLQNEATAFAAQADGALSVGKRERDEAKGARDAKATAAAGSEYKTNSAKYFDNMVAEKAGLKWWLCRQIQFVDDTPQAYEFHEQQIAFTMTPKTQLSTQEALDGNMDRAIQRIEGMKTNADTFAKRMAELTGMGQGRY